MILCRDTEKGKKVSEEIICQLPACDVVIYHCDLSSLSSVRQCAQEVLKNEPRIDILINNAGIACVPQSKSEDGYEKQFATNHLGHFLLTLLLLDRIKQSTPSRIINVSSIVHYCKWKYFNHNQINYLITYQDLRFLLANNSKIKLKIFNIEIKVIYDDCS